MFWPTGNASVATSATACPDDHDSDRDRNRDFGATCDPFNLERFIKAQDANGVFKTVLAALRQGRRKPQPATWMWFVFPQMDRCLTRERRPGRQEKDIWPCGRALTSLDEARAYLDHPILGPRLREAAQAVLDSPFSDKFTVMDNIFHDTERLHSCMTIFRQAARYPTCLHDIEHHVRDNVVFRRVLNRYFVDLDSDDEGDILDEANRELLKKYQGKRHNPTMARLDALELEAIQRRLQRGEGCACGRTPERLVVLDERSRDKVMTGGQSKEQKKAKSKVVVIDHPSRDPMPGA